MGGGSWTTDSFVKYSASVGRSVDETSLTWDAKNYSTQEVFKGDSLDSALNPYKVIRECVDTEEHPNTLPIILALDVTGSMGSAATETASKLNEIMTQVYGQVPDVEFMVMGIGDMSYDEAPIQASQFESDIRIAEQLDKIYFEFGGGGNSYESYTAAWYFGARHTNLDCWKRGKKGIIITMGDEELNPYLPKGENTYHRGFAGITGVLGDEIQGDIETKDLYKEVIEKYDVYHLHVKHGSYYNKNNYLEKVKESWTKYLDENHYKEVTLENIASEIVKIIINGYENNENINFNNDSVNNNLNRNENGEISW